MTDWTFSYFVVGLFTAIFAVLWEYDRVWQLAFCIVLWPVVWAGWTVAMLVIMLYRNQK